MILSGLGSPRDSQRSAPNAAVPPIRQAAKKYRVSFARSPLPGLRVSAVADGAAGRRGEGGHRSREALQARGERARCRGGMGIYWEVPVTNFKCQIDDQ